jgi:hypothetical protein
MVDQRGILRLAKRGGTGNEVPAANCPGEKQLLSAGRLRVAGGEGLPAAPRITSGIEGVVRPGSCHRSNATSATEGLS